MTAKVPTVFISYAWEDDVKVWVRDLAARLRTHGGVDVHIDQWHMAPGDPLPAFMENAVRTNDFVLLVCTPRYKSKADARQGGVGYEGDVITGEIFSKANHRKFIPLLRKEDWPSAAPSFLLGKLYLDFRGDPYGEAAYEQLVRTLHGQLEQPPPVGPAPVSSAGSSTSAASSSTPIGSGARHSESQNTSDSSGALRRAARGLSAMVGTSRLAAGMIVTGVAILAIVAFGVKRLLAPDTPTSLVYDAQEDACSKGDQRACVDQGNSLYNGRGVAKNTERAVRLFRSACEADELYGCVSLGWAHYTGTGTTKDASAAGVYFEKACNETMSAGCYGLSILYRDGVGRSKDPARAAELLKRGCDAGYAPGCTKKEDLSRR